MSRLEGSSLKCFIAVILITWIDVQSTPAISDNNTVVVGGRHVDVQVGEGKFESIQCSKEEEF